jgi:hypothetical protein
MRNLFDPMRFPGIEDELCLGIIELTINLLQFSLFYIFHNHPKLFRSLGTKVSQFIFLWTNLWTNKTRPSPLISIQHLSFNLAGLNLSLKNLN